MFVELLYVFEIVVSGLSFGQRRQTRQTTLRRF